MRTVTLSKPIAVAHPPLVRQVLSVLLGDPDGLWDPDGRWSIDHGKYTHCERLAPAGLGVLLL